MYAQSKEEGLMRHITFGFIALAAFIASPPSSASAQDTAFIANGQDLFRVDLATGVLSLVGDTGFPIAALALAPSGALYGVEEATDTLVTLDQSTGAATAVGPLGVDIVSYETDMTFGPGGVLWMLASHRLYTVGLDSGAATLEVGVDVPGTGIAFLGTTLYTADDRLWVVDPTTGQGTQVTGGSPIYLTDSLCPLTGDSLMSITLVFIGPGTFYDLAVIDPSTGEPQLTFGLPDSSTGLAVLPTAAAAAAVPAVSSRGLLLLGAIIAAAGVFVLARRR
jgi:hypothetical protein